MKLRNITPEPMRCVIGSCPAIHETDRGTFVIIGRRLDAASVAELLPGKVAAHEEAIEISRKLLSEIQQQDMSKWGK